MTSLLLGVEICRPLSRAPLGELRFSLRTAPGVLWGTSRLRVVAAMPGGWSRRASCPSPELLGSAQNVASRQAPVAAPAPTHDRAPQLVGTNLRAVTPRAEPVGQRSHREAVLLHVGPGFATPGASSAGAGAVGAGAGGPAPHPTAAPGAGPSPQRATSSAMDLFPYCGSVHIRDKPSGGVCLRGGGRTLRTPTPLRRPGASGEGVPAAPGLQPWAPVGRVPPAPVRERDASSHSSGISQTRIPDG